ncbi:ATPase [Thermococcus siculi]|uniref:ATPase n=1 Tax=Thermococcus siculi TaxID=72803 RepID=A0A2Z2MM61_9EURY|nr:ATP-binding protein [Thermococcus siculi]ASJ07724.1 ATPase [Thermococcus siculi]
MVELREITLEYIGALEYVEEIPREIEMPRGGDIKAIIGPRRVGKTFLMLKKAKTMLENGANVLYLPLDEPELMRMGTRELAEEARKEYPNGRVTLFLDEVQEWGEWDRKLRWLHDVKDFDLYVSGSSSALLSSEIPTRLRGRHVSRLILPLSFREIAGTPKAETFRDRGKLKALLEDYIKWGGFPEVWETRSREKVISILETVLYRDIIERFSFRDVGEFKEVFYHVLSLYGSYFTYRSLQRSLKALGVELNVKTLINYLSAMESAFLIFQLPLFSPSHRKMLVNPRKLYLVDTSFTNLFFRGEDIGRKIENIVFLELLREKSYFNPMIDISYYSDGDNEVDFVVREGNIVKKLIQVTYELNVSNYEREVLGLIKAGKKLKCDDLTVITMNEEDKIEERGKEVKVVPLYKFLLERNQMGA